MVRLAIFILRHILSAGQLKISLPGQPDIVVMQRRHYQNAKKPQSDRQVTIAIGLPSPSALLALVLRPDPLFGEYFMRGDLVLKEGSFEDFVHFLFQNTEGWRQSLTGRIYCQIGQAIVWFACLNPVGRSRRNVAHHYDLTDTLFDLFLEGHRQYSCAYFRQPEDTLELAQRQKIARLAAKLHLQPEMRVLDIGYWMRLGRAGYRDFQMRRGAACNRYHPV